MGCILRIRIQFFWLLLRFFDGSIWGYHWKVYVRISQLVLQRIQSSNVITLIQVGSTIIVVGREGRAGAPSARSRSLQCQGGKARLPLGVITGMLSFVLFLIIINIYCLGILFRYG